MWADMNTDFWVGMKTAFCVIKLSTCEMARKTTNLQRVKAIKNPRSTKRFHYLSILSVLVSFLSCKGVYSYRQHNYVLVFRRVRRIVKSDLGLSVCPLAWNNSAAIGRIFVKFGIWAFFLNICRDMKVSFKSAKNNGYFYFTWGPVCVYDSISLNSS